MSAEHNNPNTLPDGNNVIPPDGGGNGEAEVVTIHEVLSEALGRDFPDDVTAIKSVKDTFDYVGKAGKYSKVVEHVMKTRGVSEDQAIKTIMSEINAQPVPVPANPATPAAPAAPAAPAPAPLPVNESGTISREQYEADRFFDRNPQYEPHRPIIEAMRKPGQKFDDVIKDPTLSTLLEKANAHDTEAKKKSVAQPSSGLGAVPDKLKNAGESLRAGNYDAAAASAVDAVIESFPGGQPQQ